MSDLPSRDDADLIAYRIQSTEYDADALVYEKELVTIAVRYADGRLVDREAIDYEAMRQQFDENYYGVEGDPGKFMELLRSMFVAAIGDTETPPLVPNPVDRMPAEYRAAMRAVGDGE